MRAFTRCWKIPATALAAIRSLDDPQHAGAELEGIGKDLIDLLAGMYVAGSAPVLYRVLVLLCLVDSPEDVIPTQPVVVAGQTVRAPVSLPRFRLERLSPLLNNPTAFLRGQYLINDLATDADANAMADKVFPRVRGFLRVLGVLCKYGLRAEEVPMLGPVAPFVDHALTVWVEQEMLGATEDVGFYFAISPASRGDLGWVTTPFGTVAFKDQIGSWAIEVDFTAEVEALAIGRRGTVIAATAQTTSLQANFSASLPAPDNGPAFVVGATNGTRLEIGGASCDVKLGVADEKFSLGLSAGVAKSAIVIAPGDGDGFLQSVLPANGARAEFDLGLAWSNSAGLTVKGAGGLDVDVPAGLSLGGVVTVDSIHLGIRALDSNLTLECSASAGLNLGPVHVVVNRVGMLALLTFPEGGGNLGPIDASLAFKSPSGIGIAVDAACVTGGGFLSFDPDKSQYEGAANLKIEGVNVAALGLVQTRPDVSFLLLIATTFAPPIQLGLGFSLAGAGGLAGINRAVNLDALETAVWNGTARDLLFPSAPISNAVAILGELNTLFPAAAGRYVFGPTAKIVWGTPPIVTAEVGLVLELPSPIRVAILGGLVAQFPAVKPIVLLKVNFAGGIDFGTGRYFFDASLTGSRIESYPIGGDLSLRGSWASPKNLALAVGGFNPHFQPPAGFPALKRMTLDISDGPLHFHLAAYLAITSNSFQIGAMADLKAGICDCDIKGHFGFDALFIKNPFSFTVDLDASASISCEGDDFAGVHIRGTLSGPAPWHAQGSASISLMFFSVGIDFNRTWGSPAPSTLPPVDPWTSALAPALSDPTSWRGELPDDMHPVVTFAAQPSGGATAIDPAGNLVLDQNAVPLNQPIERFAESPLPSPIRFDLASPMVNNTAVDGSEWTLVTNEFAPSQFTQMTDDQKLSAESFVALTSGMSIGSGVNTGTSTAAALTYDVIVLDSTRKPGPRIPLQPSRVMQLFSAATGPTARTPWRAAGLTSFTIGGAPKASLANRSFSIVSTTNLTVQAPAVASTRYEASLALATFATQQAIDPASIQVTPQREVS